MRGESGEVSACPSCEPSPKRPLQDVGNRLPTSHLAEQKAAWKLPVNSWATNRASLSSPSTISGDHTPPLFDVSFSACPEEQAVVQNAIKAALSQSTSNDEQYDGVGTAASNVSAADAPEAKGISCDLFNVAQMGTSQALFKAVMSRDGAMLRHLLRYENASLEAQTEEGQAPLHVAAAQGYGDMVSVLALLGANLDARTRDMGDTPLHLAAAAGSLKDSGRQEVLDILLGLGASADLPNKEGRSPMHVAAVTGNISALDRLLAAGAPRGCLDKDNMRPVDLAAACGATHAVEYLNALDAKAQADKIRQYQQWLS
ncbi:probable Ankyrin-2 [Coccomyxa sp. Obi]|nr:probable Ankyrin-2 [Coccomyxa sp. Obi]